MKHRVAAKGKNMYVLLGLLALLLGSLAYLGSQRGSREGINVRTEEEKKANKEKNAAARAAMTEEENAAARAAMTEEEKAAKNAKKAADKKK